MKTFILSLFTLSVFFATLTNSSPISNDDKPRISLKYKEDGSEEGNFFKQLDPSEQAWLMNASLAIYIKNKNGTKPAPEPDLTVPNSLGPKILNGEIPDYFQSRFSTWVIAELGDLTHADINALIEGKEVCGSKTCSTLPGLGQSCCPFG